MVIPNRGAVNAGEGVRTEQGAHPLAPEGEGRLEGPRAGRWAALSPKEQEASGSPSPAHGHPQPAFSPPPQKRFPFSKR